MTESATDAEIYPRACCQGSVAVEREAIAAWHDAREKHYSGIMDAGHPKTGVPWDGNTWSLLNERRVEHRVSAYNVRNRRHLQ